MNARLILSVVVASAGLAAGPAFSAGTITNGTILLGVDDYGQLNIPGPPSPVEGTPFVGLRRVATGHEATSHGCLCEGWGVGIGDTGAFGSANNDFGVVNLTPISFVTDGVTATSTTMLTSGELGITHRFVPAVETPDLYRVTVSIENLSGVAIADLRYTRTFDWDVEPTAFSEYVSHYGVATTPSVLLAIDNGFVDSNPFDPGRSVILGGGIGDFIGLGPSDHGSNFDFGFGALAVGATFSFDIFYGASDSETAAFTAITAVSAEVASLGQSAASRRGETFIFAFGDVGGIIIDPPDVPVPAAVWMMLTAAGALGGLRRRGRRA